MPPSPPPGRTPPQTYADVVGVVIGLLGAAAPVIASLALLFFLWGLVKFLTNPGDAQARTDGRNIMFYGVIALFVMLSIWGIVAVIENTFF